MIWCLALRALIWWDNGFNRLKKFRVLTNKHFKGHFWKRKLVNCVAKLATIPQSQVFLVSIAIVRKPEHFGRGKNQKKKSLSQLYGQKYQIKLWNKIKIKLWVGSLKYPREFHSWNQNSQSFFSKMLSWFN